MKKRKASLSFIITILVVVLVTLFLLWSTFFFLSLYVSSMKQAAQTSSEQAVTQASNPDAVSEEHSTQVRYIVKQSANMAFSKA